MKTLLSLMMIAALSLATLSLVGCENKPAPDSGNAPQNSGGSSGGSGTGTNAPDTGTHSN